jgi:hypothetical protein
MIRATSAPCRPARPVTRRRSLALATGLAALLAAPATALLAAPGAVLAQAPAELDPGFGEGPLHVWLLTMDRGDQVYEMFGHNALLIRDDRTGQELAWNWGLFNFEDVDFIPRFLRGTMRYSMGPADPEPFLRSYAASNRAVHANRIHLTQAQAAELDAFVRWNFLPENRPYIYDYYRDNCSTRLRDALDGVLGGPIAAHFQDRGTGRSWRWYSRQLVQVTGWVDQGLSFLLGMRGDATISEWEAMFLPMELLQYLEAFEVEDAAGGTRPLLGPRQTLVEATRPPLPAGPPGPSWILLLAGLAGGALLVALARRVTRGTATDPTTASRVGLAALAAAWGAGSGALGALLVAAWFTDHHFIQVNLNLLHLSPLAPVGGLLLAGLLVAPRRLDRGWIRAGARWVLVVVAGLSLATAAVQAVGLLRQGNVDVIFLGLPLNLGMAVAAWRLTGVSPTFRRLPTGGGREASRAG